MTAEEFLEYIGEATHYRDKGKTRLNRARRHYAAYVKAYREQSLYRLCFLAKHGGSGAGIFRAVKDRDEGRTMVSVPELL